jgi:hypothetical protein
MGVAAGLFSKSKQRRKAMERNNASETMKVNWHKMKE